MYHYTSTVLDCILQYFFFKGERVAIGSTISTTLRCQTILKDLANGLGGFIPAK